MRGGARDGDLARAVIKAIRRLRPGEVASYGEIAEDAGYPGRARAVGNVLSKGPEVPWWRVVRADGRLVSPNAEEQSRRLRAEGVSVVDGRMTAPGDGRSSRSRSTPLRKAAPGRTLGAEREVSRRRS